MVCKTFDSLIKKVQGSMLKKRVVVVAAHDKQTLEAVVKAEKDGIVEAILIGHGGKIGEILSGLKIDFDPDRIIDLEEDLDMAAKAVEMVRENKADFIMKGQIQTADLLRAVVDREKGLRTDRVMSHIAINEIPNYHKLIAVTDGGMIMYPDLEMKKGIIENAVATFKSMGYENPKLGILAAIEKENPKMPETVDASKLKQMNLDGRIEGCIIEGPISYDLAMSKDAAEKKGYNSPVAGDVDILIVPDISTGNILGKSLIFSAQSKMAGFIVGARVPIALTSRGASLEEKYLSLVLSASAAKRLDMED